MQQGDNITFLLRKQLVMGADVAEIRGDINGLKTSQAETNGKLDQLLQLLQKPSR